MFLTDDNMFNISLLIYILINLINTFKMYKCKDRDWKIALATLPLPLLILNILINYKIIEYIIGFHNFGDSDAYGMGLTIVCANIMIVFYIVNILVYKYCKKQDKNKK